MTTYIGIDISKITFDATASHEKQNHSFANSPEGFKKFIKWIQTFETPHVAMEATGKYYLGLALALHQQAIPTYVVNPLRIKHYAQSKLKRIKTDPEDAKLIAEFCEHATLPLWQPDRPIIAKLQEYSTLQQLLIHSKTQLKNQMQTSLEPDIKAIQADQIQQLEHQINDIHLAMKACIEKDEVLNKQVKVLTTIKGISDKTAIELVTYIKDINRFDKAKQLASYAGLTPKIKQSGSSLNSASLSKMGNANLRKCLYMPAVTGIAYNPVLKAFAERLRSNGVTGKKMIAAVMRKLLHIVFAILKSGKPFDPEYKIRA